jgi:fucose 4-O-acetylase-like acetyltransferase
MTRKTKRLIIPYLSISLLLYVYWFFINRHFGVSALENYDPVDNLIGVFYAQGGDEFMDWGVPMWFLAALFSVSLIDFVVSKVPNLWKGLLIISFLLIGNYCFSPQGLHLPWSFDIAMVVYPFYFFGRLLKKMNFADFTSGKEWLIIAICFTVHLFTAFYNTPLSYYYGQYGILPLNYLNGILGSLWIFSLVKFLPINSCITWVGRNTLPILAFHLSAMTLIKAILLFGFEQEITFTWWNSFLYSALQILLLVPVILVINRYFPIFNGWRDQKITSKPSVNLEK